MRILHILTAPRAEGTPRLVLDCLAVPGYEQGVLCLSARPSDLEGDLRANGVWLKVTDVVSSGRRKYRDIPNAVAAACREFRPEIIVGWPTWTAGLIALGAMRAGRPRLVQHCGNPAHQNWRARLAADLRFMPFYLAGGRFACCSDYVRDSFRRRTPLFKSRFQTVYNCIRASMVTERAVRARKARLRGDGPVLLMVATMEAHKDHATLLRALAALAASHSELRVQLAGDGSQRPMLEMLAGQLGISAKVDFLGSRRDIPELLGQVDLFVFATTPQEGLGIVLLEAMAAGLPIVASDVPACRELLQGGRYGELVEPANPVALAAAIEHSLARIETKETITKVTEASIHAATFTPAQMLQHYIDLASSGNAHRITAFSASC